MRLDSQGMWDNNRGQVSSLHYSGEYDSGFRGLQLRISLPLLHLETNRNVGQAPSQLNNPSSAQS